MREYRLGKRFPLVFAPFNAFLHLYTRPGRRGVPRARARAPRPGGRFVFDFSVPHGDDLVARSRSAATASPRFRHPTTGELVHYAERFDYDRLRQLL